MFSIYAYGSEEQKTGRVSQFAAGPAVGWFGLRAPDHGSDRARMRAVRHGGDWILSGQKQWITNGSRADIATVWASTEEGTRAFLVPRVAPGFFASDIKNKLSLRASATSGLFREDVRLPADAQLPHAGGVRSPWPAFPTHASGSRSDLRALPATALRTPVRYANQRVQFGRPIRGFQLTQQKLPDMSLEVSKALLLALHLGRLKDAGRIKPEQISVGKMNNVHEPIKIVRTCRAILGGAGITLDYSPLRHANNLEFVLTYEGTSEIHSLAIGQALTGLSSYR